ncbi:putative UDP-rhamnose:rhamnosyltransferase 1 [Quercus lobata]|uniref:UDP-rhamnose:rhamnosyltransferase 1 n=1 Tax=Quercus lobata TaxID=97700 RepID=A0A7N2R3D2_QUELO|nr:putative UDP-rhamnose:rhamnosyltransferase 1 [Quercus lobata]
MARDHLHVVMLPGSTFGHLIPFFQLSVALAKAGIHVSFVSTPRNIQRLPKLPPNLATLINMVEFPLPSLGNDLLPEGAEATIDVPVEKADYIKAAYDRLQYPISQFIAEQLPDWIIIDFSGHWAVEIAQNYNIGLVYFSVFSAATAIFFGHPPDYYFVGEHQKKAWPSPESMTKPPKWVSFPSSVAYRGYEAIGLHAGVYAENASGISDAARFTAVLRACKALAIRSCREFEGEYLSLHEKLMGKPVIPVGLLPRERHGVIGNDSSWKMIFEWLDKQEPKSVLFVGFGSECQLSKEHVYEIAYGLQLSQVPFFWTLRKPFWAIDDADSLPLGFIDTTSGKGMVCMSWVPQMEILAHPSIGGSLFHSGWGSAIEMLQFGHCLVVLPLIYDQPLNARLLVDKGVAVEVERGEDGSFSRDGIAKAVKLAMVLEEGDKLRTRAREAAAIFGDENLHQMCYIGHFVEYLKHGMEEVAC